MSWVSVGVAGVTLGVGAYKSYQARKGLKNLNKQAMPEYSMNQAPTQTADSVAAQSMARQNANQGFSGAQTAAFQSNLAQNNNAQFQRAKDIGGGNLASAIGAGINYGNIGALNQFASQDANLQRQNRQDFYGQAAQGQNFQNSVQQYNQGQSNLNTQARLQQRQNLEMAYGGALSSGLNQMASAPGQFAAIYTGGGGGGQGGNPLTGNASYDATSSFQSQPSQFNPSGSGTQLKYPQ